MYPGTAEFALVAWTQIKRVGRWSFWRRGTGECSLQHHCRGTERCEPVDRHKDGEVTTWSCRECGAKPKADLLMHYLDRKSWR